MELQRCSLAATVTLGSQTTRWALALAVLALCAAGSAAWWSRADARATAGASTLLSGLSMPQVGQTAAQDRSEAPADRLAPSDTLVALHRHAAGRTPDAALSVLADAFSYADGERSKP